MNKIITRGLYIPGSVAKGIFNPTKMSMKGMNILCPAGCCEWQLLKPDRNQQGFQQRSVDTDCIAHAPLKTQSKMHLTASQLLIHIYALTDAILIALLKKKKVLQLLVLKQRTVSDKRLSLLQDKILQLLDAVTWEASWHKTLPILSIFQIISLFMLILKTNAVPKVIFLMDGA